MNINVNLQSCDCGYMVGGLKTNGGHREGCAATPILIPCSIPPSATFKSVGLTCHISGSSWQDSWASDCYRLVRNDAGYVTHDEDATPEEAAACRDRWQRLKAHLLHPGNAGALPDAMVTQRDEMYAALADMIRAEEALAESYSRGMAKLGKLAALPQEARKSVEVLAKYVERVLEQVGVLP